MLFSPSALAQEVPQNFAAWLELLREDARSAGISEKTLDAALADLKAPEPRVIELDQKQPDQTESIEDYVAARVSEKRIAEGRLMLQDYPTWLGRIEQKYKVQRRFIVALWGIESNYGRHTGKHPVIPALVTLAYDTRRGEYFRKELLAALKILDNGHVSLARMKGSWAGAMGSFQFMPTSYQHYAVDADGDGRIDIWGSVPGETQAPRWGGSWSSACRRPTCKTGMAGLGVTRSKTVRCPQVLRSAPRARPTRMP